MIKLNYKCVKKREEDRREEDRREFFQDFLISNKKATASERRHAIQQ